MKLPLQITMSHYVNTFSPLSLRNQTSDTQTQYARMNTHTKAHARTQGGRDL